VKIENLFFATNKTYILPQSEQAMSDLANFLLENPTVTIHLVGHTDAVGTDEANQILSEGRANSVRNDLIQRGVAAERMTAEGKGEKEPVADNDTEEGRQLNRRVEFTITDVGEEDIQQIY
jgi:outer membrane protein OmpA-like peptidoglycan-associated protein